MDSQLLDDFNSRYRGIQMKTTGVIRQIDALGRVVIPKDLREVLSISKKDSIDISLEEGKIILQKHRPDQACMITGKVSENNRVFANGKIVLSPEGISQLFQELKQQQRNGDITK